MTVAQQSLQGLDDLLKLDFDFSPELFLLFISPDIDWTEAALDTLTQNYPSALITGCSTSGEIMGEHVSDASIALTAIAFEHTRVKLAIESIHKSPEDSLASGRSLAQQLIEEELKHVFVFSEGLDVNGGALVDGLHEVLGNKASVTGGLAGDGPNFKETFVIANGTKLSKSAVGVGLYGSSLQVGFGSQGGWDSFGVDRLVTKSEDNVLYELDGEPALKLYKTFLGDKAKELPSSGLLFPLSMRVNEEDQPVVRTILGIDEEAQSLTFAGNIYEGSYVRLMKANVDRLINGAEMSAEISKQAAGQGDRLALLVSCVGRRLVLKQLVEEEVEVVREVLGPETATTGFYSYGEIAPFDQFSACSLHNQTMTITTLSE